MYNIEKIYNGNKLYHLLPLLFQFIPLLTLPFDWYLNLIYDPVTFYPKNVNGLYVFIEERGRVGIIYLLIFFISILSMQNKKYLFTIISNLLFMIVLVLFPIIPIEAARYYTLPMLFQKYGIGFYLSILSSIFNIGITFIMYRKNKKNTKLL